MYTPHLSTKDRLGPTPVRSSLILPYSSIRLIRSRYWYSSWRLTTEKRHDKIQVSNTHIGLVWWTCAAIFSLRLFPHLSPFSLSLSALSLSLSHTHTHTHTNTITTFFPISQLCKCLTCHWFRHTDYCLCL